MMKTLLFFVMMVFPIFILAQEDAWVFLTDKENVPFALANPISILTQKSIDRKAAHGVVIDDRDVPVNENYITQLKAQTSITLLAKSKWFNAVHVRGTQANILSLLGLPFVSNIEFANHGLNNRSAQELVHHDKFDNQVLTIDFNYGNTANQIQMFNGHILHEQDFTGSGMTVAIMDAGFTNVNTLSAFDHMFHAGNMLGGYDFVKRSSITYNQHYHGTMVLSDMVGYIENSFVGSAPDAQYYLFRTEDAGSENPVEESYWVEAVERADSLGVDVVNTSLGYTTYDNPNYSYTIADMNGQTAFITRGANIAFEKGLLLVNSAGNEGGSSWGIVGAPADSPGVFSVGAVNATGNYVSFSSRGSSAQPTHKPDVMAQGLSSYVVSTSGNITTAAGTSFSSPIMAGGLVCLWQALPDFSNAQIMQLVRESASQFNAPDYYMGYGIPNLQTALNRGLSAMNVDQQSQEFYIYPNPAKHICFVNVHENPVEVSVFNVLGKRIIYKTLTKTDNSIDISKLDQGVYLVRLNQDSQTKIIKLIKA